MAGGLKKQAWRVCVCVCVAQTRIPAVHLLMKQSKAGGHSRALTRRWIGERRFQIFFRFDCTSLGWSARHQPQETPICASQPAVCRERLSFAAKSLHSFFPLPRRGHLVTEPTSVPSNRTQETNA